MPSDTAATCRYIDDKELNDELKKAQRWDDPMAAYFMKKHVKESNDDDDYFDDINAKKRPQVQRCPHAALPNRFDIPPARDGTVLVSIMYFTM